MTQGGRILRLPVLPVKSMVIFPVLAFPINISRYRSRGGVELAVESNSHQMAIFAQKAPNIEEPDQDDIYHVGSLVKVIKHLKLPGNKLSVVIQGLSRIRLIRFIDEGDRYMAEVEVLEKALRTKIT